MKDVKKTVLVVDDSEVDRKLLVRALSRKGEFQAIEAENGDECLEALKKNAIDIVLMDIMMPGSFGTQVLEQIRKIYNAVELPIIMITLKSDTSDVVGCLQSGANDYITKPVNFDIAISRIATHLKLAEMSREMTRLREIAALTAMITTYNHEINNPLTVATSCISTPRWAEEANRVKLEAALWRIADIVKRIKVASEQQKIEFESYVGSTKMIKI